MPSPEQLKPSSAPHYPRVEGLINVYGPNGEHAVVLDPGEGAVVEISVEDYYKSLGAEVSIPVSTALRRQSELSLEAASVGDS